jgi:LPS-assembly protein
MAEVAQNQSCMRTFMSWLGSVGLTLMLAQPLSAATPPADPEKPLGILLSPQIINENSAPPRISVPAPEKPPLGILINTDGASPPSSGAVAVPTAPVIAPATGQEVPLISFPGYSEQIDTPNASEERPLGVLMSPDPVLQRLPQNAPPPAEPSGLISPPSQPAPSQPAPVAAPSWQMDGQSTDRPLGTLFAPDPVLSQDPANSITAPSTVPAPGPQAPIVAAPNWSTGGQTSARPLGTLFAPDKPLDFVPAPASPPTPTDASNQPPSGKDQEQEREAANFSADEMSFDRETGIVTALGDVEIHHLERSMRADKVSYNRNTGVIQASGNVVFTEPTGEKIFGERVEISGDLKDGIIKNIGVILADRSRIAGAGGQRSNGSVTEMHNAVYSPCELCKKDPTRPPVWQIKAVRVIHDKTQQIVEYRDAWIEFFGYPVLYTPYFRHPDPTVRRKSGFLFPSIGNSTDLGTIVQTPYFWNISPHEDATITPILMSNAFPVINVDYRKKLLKGEVEVSTSLTKSDDDDDAQETENGSFGTRGHLDSEGRFDINDTWRWGFDAKRTTDDTYLRRYGFASPGSLNSRLFAESFRQRSYFSASTYAFQGLELEDDQDTIPLILPLVDFNHVGDRDRFGGTTSFDFNFLALTRAEGTDTRRMSVRSRWQRPVAGSIGDIYTFSLGMNADIYHTNSLPQSANQPDYTGFSHRAIPEARLDWRLPFVKSRGSVSQTLEPIAAVTVSPYGGNSVDIPNEDSNELEFDDTNLFSSNRFSGLDRVEGGPRVAYGLKWGVYGSGGGSTSVLVGQSWRPKIDDTFATGSGLEDNFSDVVARINVNPGKHLDVSYRTRFSHDSLAPNRNEISLKTGVPALTVNANYVFLDHQTDSEFTGREELNYSINSKINRFWRAGFSGVRDMAANEFRSAGLQLIYEDECVTLTTNATRTFFEDRDIEPTDSITFRLLLKTLGEVNTGFSQSQ